MKVFSSIEEAISRSTAEEFKTDKSSSLSGGSISRSQCIKGKDGRRFFSKQNELSFSTFFEVEAIALKQIKDTHTIRVPTVISVGETSSESFLVLEFIEEGSSSSSGQLMGKQLACMHKIEQSFFGWDKDNCIGSTPQPNPRSENWVDFYREHRLQHQLKLAAQRGRSFDKAEKLLLNLEYFLKVTIHTHPSFMVTFGVETPAMIHQVIHLFLILPPTMVTGKPTLHSLICLGFSSSFYQGYEKEFPLNEGFNKRKAI